MELKVVEIKTKKIESVTKIEPEEVEKIVKSKNETKF